MKKYIKLIVKIVSVLELIWFAASYCDVLAHNVSDHCYAWWNIFDILFG